MARITLRLVGKKRVATNIRASLSNISTQAIGGLVVVAGQELTEMKRRTPVDLGALVTSGHVDGPNITGGPRGIRIVEMVFVYGGVTAPYALAVHEGLDVFHNPGEARYVAGPLEESAPFLTQRIAIAGGLAA